MIVSEPVALEGYVNAQNYPQVYHALRNVGFTYRQMIEYILQWLSVPGIQLESGKAHVLSDLLEVSPSTVYRWKDSDQVVELKHAERLTAIMDLYLYGERVFGSRDTFVKWLTLPNAALEGAAPISRLDGSIGLKLVTHLLDKIEYGAPV